MYVVVVALQSRWIPPTTSHPHTLPSSHSPATLPSLSPSSSLSFLLPQVRVFVHSATGQVTEQDLSCVGHEPYVEEEEGSAHNKTTTKSVPMDLTLGVESVESDTNLNITGGMQVRN